MDMWGPYIAAVKATVPEAEEKICFDKYHVASHLGEAVDKVRRQEHRDCSRRGTRRSRGRSRCGCATREHDAEAVEGVRCRAESGGSDLAGVGAEGDGDEPVALPERDLGEEGVEGVVGVGASSRLEPMRQKARMVRDHLQGILNAVLSRTTNALAESVNAKIQRVKRLACGVPQPRTVPQRHLLPLWRPESLPGSPTRDPHDFLKRQVLFRIHPERISHH